MIEGDSLWDLVETRAAATPGRLMLEDESGATLTFGGLETRAERTAAALAERGVCEGSTVAWPLSVLFIHPNGLWPVSPVAKSH